MRKLIKAVRLWFVNQLYGLGDVEYECDSCGYEQRTRSPVSDNCYRCGSDNWRQDIGFNRE
jgi:hypothetical protein